MNSIQVKSLKRFMNIINIVHIYFYNIKKYLFFALNHYWFFFFLVFINILFFNHVINRVY
jgi:hypothetical protein